MYMYSSNLKVTKNLLLDSFKLKDNKMLHATSCKEYPHSFICKSHVKQEVDEQ